MKLQRIDFYKHGNCWHFFEMPARYVYYSGDMIVWRWWRIAFVFEHRKLRQTP